MLELPKPLRDLLKLVGKLMRLIQRNYWTTVAVDAQNVFLRKTGAALRTIRRVRRRPMRVVLIATQVNTWKFDGLYREFAAAPDFDPWVVTIGFAHREVAAAAEHERLLSRFSDDRWQIRDFGSARVTSRRNLLWLYACDVAITMHPYSFSVTGFTMKSLAGVKRCLVPYSVSIVSMAWLAEIESAYDFDLLFMPSPAQARELAAINVNESLRPRIRVTGYPTFARLSAVNTPPNDYQPSKILWAPHWTVETSWKAEIVKADSIFEAFESLRTFIETSPIDVELIFRPHQHLIEYLPRFEPRRASELWGYFDGRNKSARDGSYNSYVDLMAEADVLVHNSFSFFTEHYLTARPMVLFNAHPRLYNEYVKVPLGRRALDAVYSVDSREALREVLEMLLLEREDPLARYRQRVREEFLEGVPMDFETVVLTELRTYGRRRRWPGSLSEATS